MEALYWLCLSLAILFTVAAIKGISYLRACRAGKICPLCRHTLEDEPRTIDLGEINLYAGVPTLNNPVVSKKGSVTTDAPGQSTILETYKRLQGKPLPRKPSRPTITGEAYVIDGDGIKVAGVEVRMGGIDAPEWDQMAQDSNGRWFNHGKHVKDVLSRRLEGKTIKVVTEGRDKYGRTIGTLFCEGTDIGEWLVLNGYAIAAYDEKYKEHEQDARRDKNGMWGYSTAYDPRSWRHKEEDRPIAPRVGSTPWPVPPRAASSSGPPRG